MFRYILRAAMLVALAGLAACASPEIPYERSSNIKTIGVITPYMDPKPTVRLGADIGQSFGLVGALIDAGINETRSNKLVTMMDAHGMHAFPVFGDALALDLQKRGYTVVSVPVTRIKPGFLKYVPQGAAVDAYLDVTFLGIGYGYLAANMGSSAPYRPFAYLGCKLVRASDGAVLMQDEVLYNPLTFGAQDATDLKAVTIAPDPAYAYSDTEEMEAHSQATVDGLAIALQKSASAVVDLMH